MDKKRRRDRILLVTAALAAVAFVLGAMVLFPGSTSAVTALGSVGALVAMWLHGKSTRAT